MEIWVENLQKDLPLAVDSVKPIVESVLSLEKKKAGCVSIYFVSKQRISTLHKKFFDDSSPTDCISFPNDEHDLGEVFVCPWAAKSYIKEHGGNLYEETTLYIVHGLLHLLGYDDLDSKDEKNMRAAEKKHMDLLIQKEFVLN